MLYKQLCCVWQHLLQHASAGKQGQAGTLLLPNQHAGTQSSAPPNQSSCHKGSKPLQHSLTHKEHYKATCGAATHRAITFTHDEQPGSNKTNGCVWKQQIRPTDIHTGWMCTLHTHAAPLCTATATPTLPVGASMPACSSEHTTQTCVLANKQRRLQAYITQPFRPQSLARRCT